MALERFIPKSPDANIRNTQDFEVAKFGHLNTIVEYINNNSAKPAGLNGYVQFNDNNALGGDAGLFWDNVNKRLGVGTVTPGAVLEIYGGVDTLGISGPANQAKSIQIARYNNSSFQSHYIGDDGGAFFGSGLTISASGTASQLYLQVSAAGRNVNIGSAGQTLLPKDLGARLGVRGSGSTSATTALLVQNSAGTTLLQTLDDATTTLAGKTFTGTGTILVPSQAHSASDIVMKGDSALISANGNANQWGKIVLCDVGASTTYQNYGQGHLFKIGTGSGTTYLSIFANSITTGASTRITMGAQDASDIYQGTGVNFYGSFLPFGGTGNTVFKNSYTAGSYQFFTAPFVDGTLVEALRITNIGRLGIGTTTPTQKLDVNGVSRFRDTLNIDNNKSLGFAYSGGSSGFSILNSSANQFQINNANYGYNLITIPDSNSSTAAVGIGTTSPTAKLQVTGNGSTSGTTSLLVQNSIGTTALSVNDASNVLVGTTTDNGYKLNVNGSINIAGGNKLNFSNGSAQCWITNEGGTGLGSRSILIPGTGGGGGFVFYSDSGGPITSYDASGDSIQIRAGSSAITGIMSINKSAASGYGGGTFIYYQTNSNNRMYTFGNPNNERGDESGPHTKIAAGAAGFLGNGGHVYLEAGAKGTQVGSVDGNIIIAATRGNVAIGTSSPTAKTHIVGSGSTSATTSLLVQNSTAAQSMKFTDDGALRIDGINGGVYGLSYYSSGVLRFGVVGYGGVFADQLTCGDSGIIVTTSTANGFAVNTAAESSMIQTRVMSSKTYAYVAKGSSGVNQFRVYDLEGTQIGAGTKEASAYLQVDSTTAGFLPPRMTTLQRTSIASPAAGLVVFDTTLQNLCYYRDGVWVQATFTAA